MNGFHTVEQYSSTGRTNDLGRVARIGTPNDKLEYRRKTKWNCSKQYTSTEFIFYFQYQAINHRKIIDDEKKKKKKIQNGPIVGTISSIGPPKVFRLDQK